MSSAIIAPLPALIVTAEVIHKLDGIDAAFAWCREKGTDSHTLNKGISCRQNQGNVSHGCRFVYRQTLSKISPRAVTKTI